MNFKIGDQVKVINNTSGHAFGIGLIVVITRVTGTTYNASDASGRNYTLYAADIEAIGSTNGELTELQEAFLSEDAKILIKLGILSTSLEITSKGKEMLNARYLMKNKKDIIADAVKLFGEKPTKKAKK